MLKRILTLLGGSKPATEAIPENPGVLPPYAAVTVTTTTKFCDAARATQARPILWSSKPKLPLPGCTMPDDCICRFRHWPDRRIGERRQPNDATISTKILQATSKPRSGRGRRKTDQ